MIRRRDYSPLDELNAAYGESQTLIPKIQVMRTQLDPGRSWVREEAAAYDENVLE